MSRALCPRPGFGTQFSCYAGGVGAAGRVGRKTVIRRSYMVSSGSYEGVSNASHSSQNGRKKAALRLSKAALVYYSVVIKLYLVDRYRSAAEASCFRTIRDPYINFLSFDTASGIRNEVLSAVRTGSEVNSRTKP